MDDDDDITWDPEMVEKYANKIEWREDEAFVQTTGEALEELTFQKKRNMRETKQATREEWGLVADDLYHERASNPKVARHQRPFQAPPVVGGMFNKVEPNQGEYVAGWRRDALTVPDRSIPALRHPKWLAGRAFADYFKPAGLDLMGPHHPVKTQIAEHVSKINKEVKEKGPIVGPKGARERLQWRAAEEKKYGKGLPNWRAADSANRAFNPLVLNKNSYYTEMEMMLRLRPARCNPKLPQMKVQGLGGLFDDDLKLLSASGMQKEKAKPPPTTAAVE